MQTSPAIKKWRPRDVIKFFEAALHSRHAGGLREIAQILSDIAWDNRQQSLAMDMSQHVPSKTVIKELYFTLDVAMMFLERRRQCPVNGYICGYMLADSSPQGNRDWLLTKSTFIHSSQLLPAFRAANALAEAEVADVDEDTATHESNHPSPNGLLLQQHLETLRGSLRDCTHPPAAMGLRKCNVAHKCAALLHTCALETEPSFSQARLINIISATTDLGVEVHLSGFRTPFRDLLPPWRAQAMEQLQPDGPAEESMDLQGLTADGDGHGDGHVDGLMSDVDDGCCEIPATMAAVPHLPPPVKVASPGSWQEAAWEANVQLQGSFMPFAMAIPGTLHTCHNLLADVDMNMSWFDEFWPQLQNLGHLLSHQMRLDRFHATCVPGRSTTAAACQKKLDELYTKRWGSITHFLRRCKGQVALLRSFWKESSFGERVGNDDHCGIFDPALLTKTLSSNMFSAYCDMVLLVHEVIEGFSGWSEGCFCHPPGQQGMRSSSRQAALGGQACPMQGRRAPELATKAWGTTLVDLFCIPTAQLTRKHQACLSGRAWGKVLSLNLRAFHLHRFCTFTRTCVCERSRARTCGACPPTPRGSTAAVPHGSKRAARVARVAHVHAAHLRRRVEHAAAGPCARAEPLGATALEGVRSGTP